MQHNVYIYTHIEPHHSPNPPLVLSMASHMASGFASWDGTAKSPDRGWFPHGFIVNITNHTGPYPNKKKQFVMERKLFDYVWWWWWCLIMFGKHFGWLWWLWWWWWRWWWWWFLFKAKILHVDVKTCDIPEMMVHGCMDWGCRIRRVLSSLPSGKQKKLLNMAIYTGFTR